MKCPFISLFLPSEFFCFFFNDSSVFIFLMLLLLSNNLNEIHLRLKLITSALYYLNHSSYSITSLEVTRALFLPLSAGVRKYREP